MSDRDLAERLSGYALDPLGFVRAVFPWGQGALADEPGPDSWQADVLTALGDSLRGAQATNDAVRFAVASGHGVGKTALSAWLVLWFLSTRDHPQVVVTANTAAQLRNKTWRLLRLPISPSGPAGSNVPDQRRRATQGVAPAGS
jgi:hypothetical protein